MSEELKRKLEENNNRRIFDIYKNVDGIKILHVYNSSDVDEYYKKAFDEIISINCKPAFMKEKGMSSFQYLGFVYEYIGVKPFNLKWLIPSFGGSTQWYEVEIVDLKAFSRNYFKNETFFDFSAFDLENGMAFNIDFSECCYEYYINRL